jgi:hypothetical protein
MAAPRSTTLPMVSLMGAPVGCEACAYHGPCGGLDGQQELWGCFGGCGVDCGAADGECDWTCPNHPQVFVRRWREVGGWPPRLTTRGLRPYEGRPQLPPYMPSIYHGRRRHGALSTSDVVVPTYKLLGRTRDVRYGSRAVDAADLRARFGLHPQARVLLLSVAQDRYLERYWRYAGSRGVPAVLAQLGVEAITIPNFSIFTDAPRTHTLWNIARMLRVGEELSAAGVTVIPHLNAGTQRDWDVWRDLLRENPQIQYVCKEFQTGLSKPDAGREAIEAMRRLRDDLGREIHPVVVGARRFIPELTLHFPRFTLVTATPFFRTMHRKQLAANRHTTWIDAKTAPGAPLDDLLEYNVTRYDARVRAAIEHARAQIASTERSQSASRQRSQSTRSQLSLAL